MPRGGARPGAGRPVGSATKRTREIADSAAATGLLPHEFLLSVVRGEMIGDYKPTFADRLEAAKAAAPFFAPKLAAVAVTAKVKRNLTDYSTDELLAMIGDQPDGVDPGRQH